MGAWNGEKMITYLQIIPGQWLLLSKRSYSFQDALNDFKLFSFTTLFFKGNFMLEI